MVARPELLWGAAGALTMVCVKLLRQHDVDQGDLGPILFAFLAGASVPLEYRLFAAALTGDPKNLPAEWPAYVGVAALACGWLVLVQMKKSLVEAWKKPTRSFEAEAASAPSDEPQPGGVD